jgi:hypothetical protein
MAISLTMVGLTAEPGFKDRFVIVRFGAPAKTFGPILRPTNRALNKL